MRQGEARSPESADSAEPAEHYYPAALASAGSASGSSPRPVLVAKEPAEGVLAVKAPADWVLRGRYLLIHRLVLLLLQYLPPNLTRTTARRAQRREKRYSRAD